MEVSGKKPENLPYTEFGELILIYLVTPSVNKTSPAATIINQIIELEDVSVQIGGIACSNPFCRLRPTTKLLDNSLQKIIPPARSNNNNWIFVFLILEIIQYGPMLQL